MKPRGQEARRPGSQETNAVFSKKSKSGRKDVTWPASWRSSHLAKENNLLSYFRQRNETIPVAH